MFFAGGDKKQVVPSDPISSLTLHRHARYRATHRAALSASPFRSPKADFSASGSMPSGHTASLSSTEPVARNGLSLARNGCSLSEASIPGSKVPACYFKTRQLALPPGPPFCSTANPGSPRWMATSSLLARCGFARRLERLLRLSPLPFGIFAFPPDQSVQQVPPPLSSPSEPARYPLAPRNQIYY